MDGRPVYLRGKPQPTLSNVHEGELVHWVGHRAGCLDVSVRSYSELIAGHLTPRFHRDSLRAPLNGGSAAGFSKAAPPASKRGGRQGAQEITYEGPGPASGGSKGPGSPPARRAD